MSVWRSPFKIYITNSPAWILEVALPFKKGNSQNKRQYREHIQSLYHLDLEYGWIDMLETGNEFSCWTYINLKLTRKILDPSKNRVLKLQTAISQTTQVWQTIYRAFERGESGLSNWFLNCWAGGPLAGSRLCAKTLDATCLWLLFSMFQNMLGAALPNVDTSGMNRPQTRTGKTEHLHSIFFWFFCPIFLISETSCQYSVKRQGMLCNTVWKSYSRVFFTIQSAGASEVCRN